MNKRPKGKISVQKEKPLPVTNDVGTVDIIGTHHRNSIAVQKERPLYTERQPVELMNMNLSCRVFNRLVTAKLDTVEKIDSVTGDYLINLRNFGVSALEELNRELKKYGWPEKVVEDYRLQQRMKEQKKIQATNQRVFEARQTKKAMVQEQLDRANELLQKVCEQMETKGKISWDIYDQIQQYLNANELI